MNNVKILCIAGSIVLGSILLSGQAFGKAPSDLITLSAPKEPEEYITELHKKYKHKQNRD